MHFFLAFAETLAKGAQTNALAYNVEASNLWAFFQAKTIRQTVLRGLSEAQDIEKAKTPDPKVIEVLTKRAEDWQKTITRWETEPETQEGRRELATRAKAAEKKRDDSMAKYHHFELASAAFQIGIVLASSMVITGIAALMWLGAAVGGVGLLFTGIGLLAPHAFHLL